LEDPGKNLVLPLLTKIERITVHFKHGSSKEFDAIILCTGKGIIWLDNPKRDGEGR
jgi:hypothetical protein